MKLSTPETCRLLAVQRHQLCRLAADGRLRKMGRGCWDSASVASIIAKRDWTLTSRARADAAIEAHGAALTAIGSARPGGITLALQRQIDAAVAAFSDELREAVRARDLAWREARGLPT